MGQILQADSIGALSHSSGVITLQASRLTIGGQQYVTTSSINRTISTDLVMTLNNLHMVYAVISGGTVQLRISTNVNSIGPAGFTAWKLVGAFYSNGNSAFGSFVNIEGVPKSAPFFAGEARLFIGGTLVTNKGVVTIDEVHIYRHGETMHMEWRFQKDSTGQSLTGAYEIAPPQFGSVPTAYQIDESKIASLVGINFVRTMGHGWWGNTGIAYDVLINYVGGNVIRGAKSDGTNTEMNTTSVNWLGQSIHYYGLNVEFPVSQWNNTPLKDL